MKFRITMKDPDGFENSIDDAVARWMEGAAAAAGDSEYQLSEEDLEGLGENRKNEMKEAAEAWFRWNEYIAVEIDTEAKTCVVIPSSRSS